MNSARWCPGVGILLITCGCASVPTMPADATERQRELASGYSLLYELVHKQSRLGGILILKSATDETKDVIEQIARVSTDAKEKISAFAQEDENLGLDHANLPVLERGTRDAIESATGKGLLFAGESFELKLLLTQTEATNYGSFLARTLAGVEENAQRKQWLSDFAQSYGELHEKVVGRLGVGKGP